MSKLRKNIVGKKRIRSEKKKNWKCKKSEKNIVGRGKCFIFENVTPQHHCKFSIRNFQYKRTFIVCIFQKIMS